MASASQDSPETTDQHNQKPVIDSGRPATYASETWPRRRKFGQSTPRGPPVLLNTLFVMQDCELTERLNRDYSQTDGRARCIGILHVEQSTALSECGVDPGSLLQRDWSCKSSATINDRIMQLAPRPPATLQPVSMQGCLRLPLRRFRSEYSGCIFGFRSHDRNYNSQLYDRPPITGFAVYRSYRNNMMDILYVCDTTAEPPTTMIRCAETSRDLLERPPIQAVQSEIDI